MIRFNFFIEEKLINKLKKEKSKHGIQTVSAFIRFIIVKFFKDIDSSDK